MNCGSISEKWYPYCGGGVVFVAVWHFGSHATPPAKVYELLGSVINVAGIVVAFLTTIKAILLGTKDSFIWQQLTRAKLDKLFFRYIMNAIHWGLLVAAMSTAGFFMDWTTGPSKEIYPFAFRLWATAVTVSSLMVYRVIHFFSRIIAL